MRPATSQITPLSISTPLPESQSVDGREPDAHDDDVRGELGAVRQHDPFDVARALELGHPDTASHVDALGAVQTGDQLTDLLAQDRGQRRRLWLHQNHVDAQLAQARGHLATDEPRADDHGVSGGPCMLAQRQALVERAQHPHALEVGERRNALGHQARCDHQLVVGR